MLTILSILPDRLKIQCVQHISSDASTLRHPAATLYTNLEMANTARSKPGHGCLRPIAMQESTVHRKLTKNHQKNAFLNSKQLDELLCLTRGFIPTAHLSSDYKKDIMELGMRLVQAIITIQNSNTSSSISTAVTTTAPLPTGLTLQTTSVQSLSPSGTTALHGNFVHCKPLRFPDERSAEDLERKMDETIKNEAWKSDFEKEWKGYKARTVSLARSKHHGPPPTLTGQSTRDKKAKWYLPDNLTREQRDTANKLKQYDVIICEADKHVGPVLASGALYREQCALTLDDKEFYEKSFAAKDDLFQHALTELNIIFGRYNSTKEFAIIAKNLRAATERSISHKTLCKLTIYWKLHKPPNAIGYQSRPVVSNISKGIPYFTAHVSNFVHHQLKELVNSYPTVLTNISELIVNLETISIPKSKNLLIATADVTALYPSIPLSNGTVALTWFLTTHSKFNKLEIDFIIDLTRWVLRSNFVYSSEYNPDTIYIQIKGTAMGTILSVVYANIYMIWIEHSIVAMFTLHILLYKRLLDDILIIWDGYHSDFSNLMYEFNKKGAESTPNKANSLNIPNGIKLTWTTNVLNVESKLPFTYLNLSVIVVNDEKRVLNPSRNQLDPFLIYHFILCTHLVFLKDG